MNISARQYLTAMVLAALIVLTTSCASAPSPLKRLGDQLLSVPDPEFMATIIKRNTSPENLQQDAYAFISWCTSNGGRYIYDSREYPKSLGLSGNFAEAAIQWSYSYPMRHPGQKMPAFYSASCLNQKQQTIIASMLNANGVTVYYEGKTLLAFLDVYGKAAAVREEPAIAAADKQYHEWLQRRAEERRQIIASFRQHLKIGDDTHCGLVVDIRRTIAQVQSSIGLTWLKIDQLYPAHEGFATCEFVNGVYQTPPDPTFVPPSPKTIGVRQ